MNYYERHIGDYAKDAGHLSMLEHGAYTLLLDRYYYKEKGIPADQVYRVAKAISKAEKAAVDRVLAEFFTLTNGVWAKNRVEEEIVAAHVRIEAARNNGKSGGRPRKNPVGKPNETQKEPSGFPVGTPDETQTLTQQKALQSPVSSLQSEESLRGDPPSIDQALYAEARTIFGQSIGGQISKAIKLKGKPWTLGVIESCRKKDQEQARSYLAAAMNGAAKPDEAEQRKAIP